MSSRFTVLLYEPMHAEGTKLLEEKCDVMYADSLEEANLIEQARNVEAIVIRARGSVTKALMGSASRLKVIGRHGVGLENIESVAEHFVGLALMLAKKLRLGDIGLRAGKWDARYELIGRELYGKTLGVAGFGRIGKQTARICRNGFGMSVLYYDVISFPEVEEELAAKRVDLRRLFREADFISINMPLLPQTRGMVNADLLKLMKPTAFLVNMARGALWNEADVVRALKENWIAGVGSDVFEEEPSPADNPLFQMDNFVGTPHMAAHTEEGMLRMSMVSRDILAVLEGRKPEFPVPEEVYAQYDTH